jgi:hypothetical protein
MPAITFDTDANGVLRARCAPPSPEFELFFDEDVQGSAATCRSFLAAIQSIRGLPGTTWSATGNAHTVTLSSQWARFEHEYRRPPLACELSLDEFERALITCLRSIEDTQARGLPPERVRA